MLVCTHSRFLIVLFQREKGLDREAHLSTEDPPTCARAWISLAHEDDRRSSCARRASRARPQAPHRRLAASFVDAARLRRDADIAAVWSEGMKIQHAMFALRARSNGLEVIRVAVAAPRSLGRAVARNRSRRRLREAFRAAITDLPRGPGYDLVIVTRPQVAAAPFPDLRTAAAAALASLGRRVRTA
jgi:ribonuclease P protein component